MKHGEIDLVKIAEKILKPVPLSNLPEIMHEKVRKTNDKSIKR